MLGYLILIFTVIPVVELYVLIKLGYLIGPFMTISIVIFTGITGAYLARYQGLITLIKIRDSINNGTLPADHLVNGFIILCSGILLITPGILTDITGFLGLIPFTRNLFKKWVAKKMEDLMKGGRVITIR